MPDHEAGGLDGIEQREVGLRNELQHAASLRACKARRGNGTGDQARGGRNQPATRDHAAPLSLSSSEAVVGDAAGTRLLESADACRTPRSSKRRRDDLEADRQPLVGEAAGRAAAAGCRRNLNG